MKIAVYSISHNEEKHVDRFMASTKGADGVFVLDTGSTDGTVTSLETAGAIVKLAPPDICASFRFDTARNLALHMIPGDFEACVVLDLDEVLSPGWREHIENIWQTGKTSSAICQVISAYDSKGQPDIIYWGRRLHSRSGWFWKYPAHVLIVPFIPDIPVQWASPEEALTIEHFPDKTKSRSNRLALLELGVQENPHDARPSHYLGREYFYRGDYDKAKTELQRHLTLSQGAWYGDRAASMRFLGWIDYRFHDIPKAIAWFLRAAAESPNNRDPWVDLAQAYYDTGDFIGCYFAAKQALKITERPRACITYGYAWNDRPYDLASISAWNLGLKDEARILCEEAFKLAPGNERIKNNLNCIMSK